MKESYITKNFKKTAAARFPAQAENLLVFFLFRYVLKAVNDGRLLPRVESCLFHVVALRYLCGTADAQTVETLQPVVSLYCKEVEHSEENLRLLAEQMKSTKQYGG